MAYKKELLDEFAAARWKSGDDVRAFIAKAGAAETADLRVMLEMLSDKRYAKGGTEQGNRIRVFAELASPVADKNLYDPFVKALKADDKHLRTVLTSLIPAVDNPPLRAKVCEYLKSPDSHLRRAAAQILLKANDAGLLRTIREYFEDRNFQGRYEAMDLAGAMPSHHAVEIFREILATGRAQEKQRAIKYLGHPAFYKSNPRAAAQIIRTVIHDEDEAVVTEAIAAYAKVASEEEFFDSIDDYLYSSSLAIVKTVVEGLRYFDSDRTIAALERKLFTGPGSIRLAVLDTIEAIGSRRVFKILLSALEHKYQPVRTRASEVLTRLSKGGKISVPDTLIWLLRATDPEVRKMAGDLVTAYQGERSDLWGQTVNVLKLENWWVRQRLLDALVEMAGEELVPHVLPLLTDPVDTIRRFALDILIKIGSSLAFETVLHTLRNDPDWWVREKAVEVLATIRDDRTVPYLSDLASSDPLLRVAIINLFRQMKAGSTAALVVSFLSDENPDVRMASLRCLSDFDDAQHADAVLALARDKDIKVKHFAKDLLARWNVSAPEYEVRTAEELSFIDKLLIAVNNAKGDDLILLPENTPYMKRHGHTMPLIKNRLTAQQLNSILLPILNRQQKSDLQNLRDVDFSYEVRSEQLRFRSNIFMSRTGLSGVFRIIKGNIVKLEDLGLPSIVESFGSYKDGLVLVGGPTGSGKSTTLTTIINHINLTSKRHVISIEDPIEAVHSSAMGLINQREVGVHTPSFDHALKMTLREDPDVILVGEMRDLATIQFAVTAAETGHLVFGTVHTVSADSSVDRLINAYPPEVQDQVRSMLADSLRAVLCQYLIRHKEKQEVVLATELMLNNGAIANLIRKGKPFQLSSVIATSREQNMILMDTSLLELYKAGRISAEEAYLKSRNKEEFEELLGMKVSSEKLGSRTQPAPNKP